MTRRTVHSHRQARRRLGATAGILLLLHAVLLLVWPLRAPYVGDIPDPGTAGEERRGVDLHFDCPPLPGSIGHDQSDLDVSISYFEETCGERAVRRLKIAATLAVGSFGIAFFLAFTPPPPAPRRRRSAGRVRPARLQRFGRTSSTKRWRLSHATSG